MHSPTELIRTFPPPPAGPAAILTPREREIVLLIAYRALTNKEISFELGTSEQTVKNQITVIFRKLGALSRAQLALYVIRGGAL